MDRSGEREKCRKEISFEKEMENKRVERAMRPAFKRPREIKPAQIFKPKWIPFVDWWLLKICRLRISMRLCNYRGRQKIWRQLKIPANWKFKVSKKMEKFHGRRNKHHWWWLDEVMLNLKSQRVETKNKTIRIFSQSTQTSKPLFECERK